MSRRFWTDFERQLVRWLYPHVATAKVAALLGCAVGSVYDIADRLGVAKSPAYLAGPEACRLRRGDNIGAAFRFTSGHTPANKGLRRPGWAPGRMRETQFKRGMRTGSAARNWRPVGTVLSDADGYLRIKIKEAGRGEATGFGNVRVWPLLQRHVWEQAYGPIPLGHNVVFRDGNRANCELPNLELISRAEMMRRNSIHTRYPKELVELIQLNGALKRKLRRRTDAAQ